MAIKDLATLRAEARRAAAERTFQPLYPEDLMPWQMPRASRIDEALADTRKGATVRSLWEGEV